jgi:hypothetical protein
MAVSRSNPQIVPVENSGLDKFLLDVQNRVQLALADAALDTYKLIGQQLQPHFNKKKATQRLEEAFKTCVKESKVHKEGERLYRVGIGDIALLERVAPHWKYLEFGTYEHRELPAPHAAYQGNPPRLEDASSASLTPEPRKPGGVAPNRAWRHGAVKSGVFLRARLKEKGFRTAEEVRSAAQSQAGGGGMKRGRPSKKELNRRRKLAMARYEDSSLNNVGEAELNERMQTLRQQHRQWEALDATDEMYNPERWTSDAKRRSERWAQQQRDQTASPDRVVQPRFDKPARETAEKHRRARAAQAKSQEAQASRTAPRAARARTPEIDAELEGMRSEIALHQQKIQGVVTHMKRVGAIGDERWMSRLEDLKGHLDLLRRKYSNTKTHYKNQGFDILDD